jgi:hypothetical protein
MPFSRDAKARSSEQEHSLKPSKSPKQSYKISQILPVYSLRCFLPGLPTGWGRPVGDGWMEPE